MTELVVPEVVRNRARTVGAATWLRDLPELIADIERQWSITVGVPYDDATEAFVARAELADGTPAVLKLLIPRATGIEDHEITVLRLTDGQGCVRLLRDDRPRGAMLLEQLGRSLEELDLPIAQRHEILCSTATKVWRPAPDCGLPTGAQKGRWLIEFITETWEKLNRPCTEQAVAYALDCAAERIEAHDDERAVLVHGDVHQWNVVEAGADFKLIDPDGLLAEAEYDMGIVMREDPVELLHGDPYTRARWLAQRCNLDATAIWQWGVVERVSMGLICTEIGLQPEGRDMLTAADHIAALARSGTVAW